MTKNYSDIKFKIPAEVFQNCINVDQFQTRFVKFLTAILGQPSDFFNFIKSHRLEND